MFRRFDIWLGKTMFVPLAIRICQQFKISQYALHTYIWFVVWLTFVWDGPGKHPMFIDWVGYTFVCILALIWTLTAALVPDIPFKSTFVTLRIMWATLAAGWLCFALPLDAYIGHFIGTDIYYGTRTLFILLAEYAITIKTIPPLEKEERKAAGKVARQEA